MQLSMELRNRHVLSMELSIFIGIKHGNKYIRKKGIKYVTMDNLIPILNSALSMELSKENT